MGNFWGSIHLRTEDRDQIHQLLTQFTSDNQSRYYLGPPIKGWIAVYPSENGQDFAAGERLARETNLDTFHLLLHDDDIFAYRFYRNGELLDEFNSTPGYFSESDRAAEEPLTGNPARYADLLQQPILKVKELLTRGDDTGAGLWQMERFEQFAKALSLANAATAYEYLEQGEWENIKHRRRFIHIPERASGKQAAREQANAFRSEVTSLKKSGALLAEYPAPKLNWIYAAPDPTTGGFPLNFARAGLDQLNTLANIAPPWPKKPQPFELPLDRSVTAITVAPTTHTAVFLTGRVPDIALEFWNLRERQLLNRLPGYWGHNLRFSHDAAHLIAIDRDAVTVLAVPDGQIVKQNPLKAAHGAILHPDNRTLLINAEVNLLLTRLDSDATSTIYLGGRSQLAAAMAQRVRKQFAQIDLEKYEQTFRAGIEKNVKKMSSMFARHSGKEGVPQWDEQTESKMREEMEQQIARFKEGIQKAKSGQPLMPDQALERIADFAFSADGRSLYCATHTGLKIYDWPALAAGNDTAARTPKHTFTAPFKLPHGPEIPASFHALAEDPTTHRLHFAANNGVLYTMDLRDNRILSFQQMPRSAPIFALTLSADRTALATLCQPHMTHDAKRPRTEPTLYIWNATKLARAD